MRALEFPRVFSNVWYAFITENMDRTNLENISAWLSSMSEVTVTYIPTYIILHVLIYILDTCYRHFFPELYI